MGGIFKHIYSVRLQFLGAESTRSLTAPAFLHYEAAGLLGRAVVAGGRRGTGLRQGFHPGCQNTLKLGVHLTAPGPVWNWHKAALVFPSLREVKHSVLQSEIQAPC